MGTRISKAVKTAVVRHSGRRRERSIGERAGVSRSTWADHNEITAVARMANKKK